MGLKGFLFKPKCNSYQVCKVILNPIYSKPASENADKKIIAPHKPLLYIVWVSLFPSILVAFVITLFIQRPRAFQNLWPAM